MGCYYTLYLNTYDYSLLFYKVYHEEGECQQLEFWLEKEQTLETYSAQLQKSWNFTGACFRIYKKYWAKEVPEGAHPPSTRVGGVPRGVGRASLPRGLLEASLTSTPSLLDCFRSKNNSPEGFIPFGLRLIFLFFETLN